MTYQGFIDQDFLEHRARMAKACTDALDDIDAKLRFYEKAGRLKLWQMNDRKRLIEIRREINKTLAELQYLIEPEVMMTIEGAYETGYLWNACTIEGTVGKASGLSGFSFAGINETLLQQSVNRKIAGLTVSDRLSADRLGLLWHERDAIAKSKLLGYGEAKTARQVILTDVKEGVQSSFYRACMIARTESTRNATQAIMDTNDEAEAYDIETRLEWLSGHDDRVRESHRQLDGKVAGHWSDAHGRYVFMVSGQPSLGPGHCASLKDNVNCRCSTVTICIGYSEFYPSEADFKKYRRKYMKKRNTIQKGS